VADFLLELYPIKAKEVETESSLYKKVNFS